MRRAPDLWLSEQVEWLAMILAITLVLKFFVLEAYTIPTGSMQPTILGDAEAGLHDRVLVDKLAPLLGDPERWQVTIFRLPLDERELYVKRLVGLPGETLELRGGDVWIDGKIARKPPAVQASMLRGIAWTPDGGMALADWFRASDGVTLDGRRAHFPDGRTGTLALRETVTARYDHGYDPAWGIRPPGHAEQAVADLEVAFTLVPSAGTEAVAISFQSDEGTLALALPRTGAPVAATAAFEALPGAGAPDSALLWRDTDGRGLDLDRESRITASWIDRRIRLRVGDELWLVHDQDDLGPRTDRPRVAGLALSLAGGGELRDVVIRRDVYYPPRVSRPRWEIPPEHYFMLGDNAQASLDSRLFEARTVVLPDREVTGFWLPAPAPDSGEPAPPGANPLSLPDGRLAYASTHGDITVFDPADVVAQRSEPAPFIHGRYLLGKVLAVYWPVRPHFRWRLIR